MNYSPHWLIVVVNNQQKQQAKIKYKKRHFKRAITVGLGFTKNKISKIKINSKINDFRGSIYILFRLEKSSCGHGVHTANVVKVEPPKRIRIHHKFQCVGSEKIFFGSGSRSNFTGNSRSGSWSYFQGNSGSNSRSRSKSHFWTSSNGNYFYTSFRCV